MNIVFVWNIYVLLRILSSIRILNLTNNMIYFFIIINLKLSRLDRYFILKLLNSFLRKISRNRIFAFCFGSVWWNSRCIFKILLRFLLFLFLSLFQFLFYLIVCVILLLFTFLWFLLKVNILFVWAWLFLE